MSPYCAGMPASPATPTPGVLSAPILRDGTPVRPIPVLAPLGVDAFVTSRAGGVSAPPFDTLNLGDHVGDLPAAVAENRRRVARAIGVADDHLVIATQVHGADVVAADSPAPRVADAITTVTTDVAVAVLVADCAPLLLIAPARHALAVVHAGWRGLVAGVIPAAVGALGGAASEMVAVVGPRISGAAYQVGPDVAHHFADAEGALEPDVDDRSRLDLARVAVAQLLACGVAAARIHVSDEVTDGGAEFFSDRAARPCGRFGLVARWSS